MPRSTATTVAAYLDELPPDRRKELEIVRAVIRARLPAGYEERVSYGMISYEIPLSRYKSRHNPNPLAYAALAAHKNYNTVYLMAVATDGEARLRAAFAKAGKKLDIGKSCVRFRSADDLALDAIGDVIASTTPDEWIRIFEASRTR